MKPISILGIGYVGMVQIVCLARAGFKVIAYDKNPEKNRLLKAGKSIVVEPGLQEGLDEHFEKITVALDPVEILEKSDITYICVGTPTREDGRVNLGYLFGAAEELARALKNKPGYRTFVVRSTVPPGTAKEFIKIMEDKSGKKRGADFGYVMHPEFMREGSGIEDFMDPPFTILGAYDPKEAEPISELYKEIGLTENIFVTTPEEAELFKYLNNAFHALKISFANEVARLSKKLGVDALKLMRIFVLDKKLNISPYYMSPGMPFGGYCLPKDTRGLKQMVGENRVDADVLLAVIKSNEHHFAFVVEEIENMLRRRSAEKDAAIGIIGVAFKKGVDDLRESPYVRIMRDLIERGHKVQFYDPLVNERLILGANLQYIKETFPDFFTRQLNDPRSLIEMCGCILLGCGNGIEDLLADKNLLEGKNFICLEPKLYDILAENGIAFRKII